MISLGIILLPPPNSPSSFQQTIQTKVHHCDLLLQVGGLGLQTPIVLFSTVQEMEALPIIEKLGSHL